MYKALVRSLHQLACETRRSGRPSGLHSAIVAATQHNLDFTSAPHALSTDTATQSCRGKESSPTGRPDGAATASAAVHAFGRGAPQGIATRSFCHPLSTSSAAHASSRGQHRAAGTAAGGGEAGGRGGEDDTAGPHAKVGEGVEETAEEEAGDDALAVLPDPAADILSQPPTGQPLNPGRRGSAAWEPFLDEDPFEGLEEYGGKIESIDDYDEMMEQWGELMEAGEYAAVLAMLDAKLPPVPGIPPLDDFINWKDPREEMREQRRALEKALQEEYAARRVRDVDAAGRAYATGKRKTAVARVWIWPGPGAVTINRRALDLHFPVLARRAEVLAPFEVTGTLGEFSIWATVKGGGSMGQAQAVRHGVACALQKWDPALRPELKREGFLTRDSRVVERKKPGLAKARKAFQWVKR